MTTTTRTTTGLAARAAGLGMLAIGFAATPALAAGGGGGGDETACSGITTKSACEQKSRCTWSASTSSCKPKQNQLHGSADRDRYAKAVAMIEKGEYAPALEALKAIGQRDAPQVLNYIGYATRKLGDVDRGIAYYHEALEIDPDFVLAREYLGEGYLQKGAVDKATAQLHEIAARCGTDCREYAQLSNAIVEHVTGVKLGKTW